MVAGCNNIREKTTAI